MSDKENRERASSQILLKCGAGENQGWWGNGAPEEI